ncbi:response regulator transcription factor [Streptomyces sp. KS_5]|uniref:LuxR C-terminal-related transcriptional regulator n=1 Tax=Streptomyces sp. KS_5 TaxID=1881018 RepID=UPI00089DA1A5|nr:response regulator transcription factor [Streptomyces sp. KS_5]SEE35589.1 DNA-binding response regulator, NarL/FixJ family, contains REC and HTH domains [Streptomyces sp. KS_5]
MCSVLVAHDQTLQRTGLRLLLEAESDLTVVGEAATPLEAAHMSTDLRPATVILGSHGADPDGLDAIRRITRSEYPDGNNPHVLVLTPAGGENQAYAALRAGACGFLLEDATPAELAAAVRIVAAGNSVITPGLTRALIATVRQDDLTSRRQEDRLSTLTRRERDILTAVASGWSNAEISERLSISATTVKTHVSHILAKIGVHARVQAVVFAYESGLVQPAA